MSRQLALAHVVAAFAGLITLLASPAAGVSAWAADIETFVVEQPASLRPAPEISIILEGEPSPADVRVDPDGQHYLDATPILAALDDDIRFDAEANALHVTRSQDRVTMTLFANSGLVQADGKDLGHLRTFGTIADGQYFLTPNAIAILSGTRAKYDEESKTYTLELDPRLKTLTGFDIFVNARSLINISPEPRSVGPVLLLPLRPIADELGHIVTVDNNMVRVERAQDSAVFTLDLDTGLISLAGNPIGVTRDVTFIDPVNLLLPSGAIETLTGTNISTDGAKVEVDLDDRLAGAVEAGRSVEDIAADTPFTPESLSFALGPRQVNRVDGTFSYRGVNAGIRYEIADMPDEFAELEPSWLSLDFQHISGVQGSIGDLYAKHRQVGSVGTGRLRGVSLERVTTRGRWSAAAGAPQRGSRRISEDQFRTDYGGFAAGARWQDADGWEAGLAVATDSVTHDQRAVLDAIANRLGTTGKVDWRGAASVGAFNGPSRTRTVDVSGTLGARARLSDTVEVDAFATYSGVEFQRSVLSREQVEEEARRIALAGDVENDEGRPTTLPDIRSQGLDTLEFGATLRVTPEGNDLLVAPALSLSAEQQIVGVTASGAREATRNRVSAGAATGIGSTGVSLSLSASAFETDGKQRKDNGFSVQGSAYRSFNTVSVRADYEYTETDSLGVRTVANATASVEGRTFNLPRAASLTITPSVSATVFNGDAALRGSVVAGLNSGELLGAKNRIGANFGVLQSLSEQGRMRTRTFLTVDAARRLRIGNNMALGLAYTTDLSDNHRVGLTLSGRYDFATKRRLAKTRPDTGVLTGQAFYDRNRDGVRQNDEPSLPGIGIELQNTRFKLRADANGAFTIRNLRKGIYNVSVIGTTLPLGFAQSESAKSRASIADGRVTDISIPVVQRGQLRGYVYVDDNGNGMHDAGEPRPEGTLLTLVDENGATERLHTTTFGQYAFDDLMGQRYTVEFDGREVASIDLSESERLMGKLAIALPAKEASVAAKDDPPDRPGNTGEPGPPEPAP